MSLGSKKFLLHLRFHKEILNFNVKNYFIVKTWLHYGN